MYVKFLWVDAKTGKIKTYLIQCIRCPCINEHVDIMLKGGIPFHGVVENVKTDITEGSGGMYIISVTVVLTERQ